MSVQCRVAAAAIVAGLAAFGPSCQAHADTWPSRPITIVVPFPAGGASDQLVRVISAKLSLGQSIVVENKTGAGGMIGASMVARAAPDGYTFLLGTIATHAINPALRAKMTYNAAKDFEPVILLGSVPNVLLTNPQSPYKSVSDLVAAAKKEPGKIQYGTPGLGTSQHLSAENFKALSGAQITHVPYRGSPVAIMDLISGQIPITFDTVIFAQPYVQSGQVKALAVTSAKRSTVLPDVPTMQEAGVKGMDVESWQAIYVPAGTPRAIVDKMNANIREVLAMPDVKAKMASLGMNYTPNTAPEFAKFDAAQREKWQKIVSSNHLTLD